MIALAVASIAHACLAQSGMTLTSTEECILADVAEQREWEQLTRLIRQSVPSVPQPDGMTALHWAVFRDHAPAVAQLLAVKEVAAQIDAVTDYGVTPLSIACEQGAEEIVDLLIKARASIELARPGKITPLLIASRNGNPKVVRALIESGANLNARDARGQTPLMWAAAAGNDAAVKLLIEAHADLNLRSDGDFAAIHFAARQGQLESVRMLIDAGVDVTQPINPKHHYKRIPRNGTSALTLAVESGHFQLAMFLIEKGADPNDQRSGYAPLHQLSWVRKPNRGEEPDGDPPPRGSGSLTSLQFVRAIVTAGANVNLRLEKNKGGNKFLNHQGATPLLLAAKTADLDFIEQLVALGADPTTPNADNCTPLMAAAGVGVRSVDEEAGTQPEVLETLEFLLAHGNDIDAVDKNQETAMHGAAYRCFPLAVEFLGQHGSQPKNWNHKNASGWTPTRIAEGYRPGSFKPHPETVAAIQNMIDQHADHSQ